MFVILFFFLFQIEEMIRQKGEESGLTLTPNYNTTRGFFIQINTAGNENLAEALPAYFIKVVKSKNFINCTTEDLVIISFFGESYCNFTNMR